MSRVGEEITVGSIFAKARNYTEIVGRKATIIRFIPGIEGTEDEPVRVNCYLVDVIDDFFDLPFSRWYINEVDIIPADQYKNAHFKQRLKR